tara:strand:+ start:52 stop:1029 length:978 start_codon:yes stop_codon:yes gene_type:complete
MNNTIAVSVGDIKGIGIEILINAWKNEKIKNFILFTDIKVLTKYLKNNKKIINNINVINTNKNIYKFKINKLNVFSFKSRSLEDNAYKSLINAYNLCKQKLCIGILTLPLSKDSIIRKVDKKFIGHTEFFQKKDNKKFSNMILFHKKVIISPITTHIAINKVSKFISNKNFLYNQILNINNTLKIDFNIKTPKLMVSGLNPHAGENGKVGIEELKYIIPVIKKLKQKGITIDGPNSADSILIKKNLSKYDCFIFMYHDQALIPFKFISQFSGVNYTGNLSFIRTSPDHGTAYNLVGSKLISHKSFLNSYKLIKEIYKNRKIYEKT